MLLIKHLCAIAPAFMFMLMNILSLK